MDCNMRELVSRERSALSHVEGIAFEMSFPNCTRMEYDHGKITSRWIAENLLLDQRFGNRVESFPKCQEHSACPTTKADSGGSPHPGGS
jgi:hypothetical protein